MTKIQINSQFCKQISPIKGLKRTILWILQQKTEGIIQIPKGLIGTKHSRTPAYISSLAKTTITVLKRVEGYKYPINVKTPIFDHISYNRGKINYKFSAEAQKILKTKGYFSIDLDVYQSLKKHTTKLLYELLCQFVSTKKIGQRKKNFTKNLGFGSRNFRTFGNFEKFLLAPAVTELEAKTPFYLKRKNHNIIIRIGKYIYFEFDEKLDPRKTPAKTTFVYSKKDFGDNYRSLYTNLLKYGVPARIAKKGINVLGDSYLSKLIYTWYQDCTDNMIHDPQSALIAKIKTACHLVCKDDRPLPNLRKTQEKGISVSQSKDISKRIGDQLLSAILQSIDQSNDSEKYLNIFLKKTNRATSLITSNAVKRANRIELKKAKILKNQKLSISL